MSTKAKLIIIVAAVVVLGLALTLTQRRDAHGRLRAGFDAEFLERPDGYPGLSEHYDLSFANPPRQLDPGLMYRACADGAVDVICAFATDGRIAAYDLYTLEDDKNFFPPYDAAPLVRQQTLEAHPELEEALNRLAGRLNDETMRELNYRVDEQREREADVAREWLIAEGLIPEEEPDKPADAPRIAIGSKHFTEQEILGEMVAYMIDRTTDLTARRRLNLGGTMVCFNALRAGDLDVYVEYTGTGLVNILDREVSTDPQEAYDTVKEAFLEEYGLVWLEPLGFNNTYTLTMRGQHAQELGLETISDLAQYIREQEAE